MIDLRAGGYFRYVGGSYVNEMDKRPISWVSQARDWQVDLQETVRPISNHVITVGMEVLSNKIEFGDIEVLSDSINEVLESGVTDRITNAGAYLQDEWEIGELFRVVPGIRVDYHTVFGYAVSPKLGLSFTASDAVHVRGSFGRAFRAPNHTELFMPPLPLKDTITIKSNPNLTPEYIWAGDD